MTRADWDARLDELALLKDGWKNGSCDAPNAVAISNARAWLSQLDGQIPIQVYPATDGGILCEFVAVGLDLGVEFSNSGEYDVFGIVIGDRSSFSGPKASHEAALEKRVGVLEAALAPLARIDAKTDKGHAFDPWADHQVVFDIGSDRKITAGDLRRARKAAA